MYIFTHTFVVSSIFVEYQFNNPEYCFLRCMQVSYLQYLIFIETTLPNSFNILSYQASKNCKPILIPMSMMNGQRMIVEADSASTVQELVHQICHKAGLQDSSGFSIYITLMQRVRNFFSLLRFARGNINWDRISKHELSNMN